MPRPTKLTPERQEKIVQAILAGNYFETACGYAGVAPATGYEWLARGEGKDPAGRKQTPLYVEFAEGVRAAEAQAEVQAVAIIRQGFPDNPRLALDFLARRHPGRWGQRDTLTVLQKLAREVQDMSDEDLLTLVGGRDRPAGPGEAGTGGGQAPGDGGADTGTANA